MKVVPGLASRVSAALAKKSLRAFAEQAWPIVEPSTQLVWGKHLDAVCSHLEAVSDGRIRNLLINIPPGHSKSLFVSVFWPAWMWTRRPEWRAIFASYSYDLALRDAKKCRDVIYSPWYGDAFVRNTWEASPDQDAKHFYMNTRTGFRISTTVGGTGTGHRGDAVVIDDPLNASDAFSEAKRKEVIDWWKYTIGNRLSNMATGVRVVIMQRLHEEDLSGYVLREERDAWVHLCLPSEFEPKRKCVTPIGWEDWRAEEGELLFPAMFPAEVIAGEKRRLGSIGYPGQHQQTPTASEGGMFQRKWWRFWRRPSDPEPPANDPVLGDLRARTVVIEDPAKLEQASSWDCAFKETKDTDKVAGGVWGKRGADFFLLDLVWDRMDFVETLAQFRSQAKRWPLARTRLVEDKANGPAVISTLKHEIPGIIAVNPEGGKEARAAATSPLVEAGNVYLPLWVPWRDDYIEEHRTFPLGAHDDVVDQQSQMLLRWHTKGSGRERFIKLATR